MPDEQNKNPNAKYLWIILAAVIFAAAIVFVFAKFLMNNFVTPPNTSGTGTTAPKEKNSEIKKFASAQEFQDYLEKSKNISASFGGRGGGGTVTLEAKSADTLGVPQTAAPSRVSETNVQVAGIDEPDAVKTDGKEIYFSTTQPEFMPLDDTVGRADESNELSSLAMTGGTKTINAFPQESLKVASKIDKSGDLLLIEKTLIVIPSQRYYWSQNASKIYGYDVSNPENPKEIWNIELKNSTSIAGARLYNGKIYLVTKTNFEDNQSCLLKPLIVEGAEFTLKCTDIYRPTAVVPADSAYTAMIVNPANGNIEKNISFVGSNDAAASAVYMSPSAIYITYYNPGDFVKILASYFSENKDLTPDWLLQKLKNLEDYDISSSAKMTEIGELVNRFENSLSNDDRLKLQNEMANRSGDYLTRHRRDLDSTGIVKIKADNLSIDSTGSVPGKLLNQFSLDEYRGDLRVATTIGENFFGWGFGFGSARAAETANDVYILSDKLKTEGSVLDLGKGEKIFSVRFIEDKGYLVTFKQVDPFFVLDLSDPLNPTDRGELKIPGYSSYLHPIAKDKILGIGEENNQVKVTLFDVRDPDNPQEISKYNLDESYSEISQTHHAFLQDEKHQVFFFPGAKGGYVFSYAGDNLKLVKTVADIGIKRAVYIDNFLYVIGEDKLVVLDEGNWEKVNELDL